MTKDVVEDKGTLVQDAVGGGTPVWVSCQIMRIDGKNVKVEVQRTFRDPQGRGLHGKAAKKRAKKARVKARKMAHQLELREGLAGYYDEPFMVSP